jgi:hypothetical protein
MAPRLMAGLAGAGLPEAVAKADRLFFHAALYANFAANPAMVAALEAALSRPAFAGLEVVSLDVAAATTWRSEFFAVLRQGRFPGDLLADFAASRAFLDDLAGRHPGRVRLYAGQTLPLAPILLLSDTIFVGHYLHGPVPAPLGLWLAIPADVPRLARLAEAGLPPRPGDGLALAAFRYVHECMAARDAARRVDRPLPRSTHATD